jgi:hypothetical protein
MTSFRKRASWMLFWIDSNITVSPSTSMALLYGHPPMPTEKLRPNLDLFDPKRTVIAERALKIKSLKRQQT